MYAGRTQDLNWSDVILSIPGDANAVKRCCRNKMIQILINCQRTLSAPPLGSPNSSLVNSLSFSIEYRMIWLSLARRFSRTLFISMNCALVTVPSKTEFWFQWRYFFRYLCRCAQFLFSVSYTIITNMTNRISDRAYILGFREGA